MTKRPTIPMWTGDLSDSEKKALTQLFQKPWNVAAYPHNSVPEKQKPTLRFNTASMNDAEQQEVMMALKKIRPTIEAERVTPNDGKTYLQFNFFNAKNEYNMSDADISNAMGELGIRNEELDHQIEEAVSLHIYGTEAIAEAKGRTAPSQGKALRLR